MHALFTILGQKDPLRRAMLLAILVGMGTSCLVLSMQPSHDQTIESVGNFLGNTGNDIFLLLSNLLIIGWAWRKRLTSIITLTLSLDLMVWIFVQGIKLLHIGPWYLRPNGGAGGFPSGHATHSFVMAFLLTLYFPRFAWIWYFCAAAISWSRVETSWHTGIQVTAGMILGATLLWIGVSRWLAHPEAAILQTAPVVQSNVSLRKQPSYVAE